MNPSVPRIVSRPSPHVLEPVGREPVDADVAGAAAVAAEHHVAEVLEARDTAGGSCCPTCDAMISALVDPVKKRN